MNEPKTEEEECKDTSIIRKETAKEISGGGYEPVYQRIDIEPGRLHRDRKRL